VADLLAQSPRGRVLESKFKGLSDIALSEARRLGCSYADIRFTRNINDSVAVRDRIVTDSFGFGGGGGREESAGFGVRVIHSGVWGFASSPIVTEDEIRKITAQATDVAKASAISKRFDVRLAPVPAYTDYWACRSRSTRGRVARRQDRVPDEDQRGGAEAARTSSACSRRWRFDFEWKYLATSEGSYLEQEIWRTAPSFTVTARKGQVVKTRTFTVAPRLGGYEVATRRQDARERRAHRAEAASTPRRRRWASGLKDIIMTPSHAMLTIHEIVGHPPNSTAWSATRPTTPAPAS
jgi:TldD protein